MISTVVVNTNQEVLGIAVDNNGIIYYTLNSESGLMCFDPKTKITENLFSNPNEILRNVVFDGMDTLYIASSKKFVLIFSISKKSVTGTVSSSFINPTGITIDEKGVIFVADVTEIRRIAKNRVSTCLDRTVAANVAVDMNNYYITSRSGDTLKIISRKDSEEHRSEIKIKMASPRGMILHLDGSLLVADENRIKILDTQSKKIVGTHLELERRLTAVVLAKDKRGTIYVGTTLNILKILPTWEYEKFLWIGKMKEDASYCLLAVLPKEIIREIAWFIQSGYFAEKKVVRKDKMVM